jgi:cytochrome o ubiquinol oxidase subunit 2
VSSNRPVAIKVVALRWKWLFIYPEQNIATVNFVEFPERTPVHFELTADAPMSSFWIPQLGTQIYAMAAMQTQLNVMANSEGEYAGKNMEINGAGYADMNFKAKSVSRDDFDAWIQHVKQASSTLDQVAYEDLAKPTEANPVAYYSSVTQGLYDSIMMKFMMPGNMQGMKM